MKKNKQTGFWIRFISRVLDVCAISFISILTAFIMMSYNNGWHFKNNFYFYIWTLEFMILCFLWFVLIPVIKGQTLFMWVFRIKIIFHEKKFISMIKRELFFSISWIFMMFLVMVIINHTLILEFVSKKHSIKKYTNFEKIRINLISSIGGVLTLIQFITSISICVRGDKKGLHDTFSKTQTVWKNKYIKINKEFNKIIIKPKIVKNIPVEWMD